MSAQLTTNDFVPPDTKRKAPTPLPVTFANLTRTSQGVYIFGAHNVTTNRFEDEKQGGFLNGQTYSALIAIEVEGHVHKTANMSLDHLRKFARHIGFGTGMSCMRKQAIILTLGRLNSGPLSVVPTMTQAYKRKSGTVLRLINVLFSEEYIELFL